MRAIITQPAGGSIRAGTKGAVGGAIRPKVAVAVHITRIVVGVGNGPGTVILVGRAGFQDHDVNGVRRPEENTAGAVQLKTVGIRAGSFRHDETHGEGGLSSGRDRGAAANRCGWIGRLIGLVGQRHSTQTVLAKNVHGVTAESRTPSGGAGILHRPSLGEHRPGQHQRAVRDQNGKQLRGVSRPSVNGANHHAQTKQEGIETSVRPVFLIFHICRFGQ